MRGRNLGISTARRIVGDVVHAARKMPLIALHRRMQLGPLVGAREAAVRKVPWTALFCKAFAIVCREQPELRRVHLDWPWPRLFMPQASVATIACEREIEGEPGVLLIIVKDPASKSLDEIARAIEEARTAPIDSVPAFRRVLRVARLSRPIRRLVWQIGLNVGRQRLNYFGSFAITTVAALGAEVDFARAPVPVLLTYGGLDGSGAITVRMIIDHRTLDGGAAARALMRLEEVLCGAIVSELERGA